MKDERGSTFKYKWTTWGDLNAFFGLMLDNVLNLVVLAGLLAGVFGFPKDFVLTRMIPGTALGVMIGDVLYAVMAFRLAKRLGRQDVTAMPLGLDTPSTIGIALAVIGPVYAQTKNPETAWHVGMATTFLMGVAKTVFAFFGEYVRRNIPQAGLLGAIGGVGIALLCFFPIATIFSTPVVGMAALGLVIYSLVARLKLPGGVPGAFGAVAAGAALYYGLGAGGLLGASYVKPALEFTPGVPLPTLSMFQNFRMALDFLPIAIPFGLLTIIGGINVTESARVAGDSYNTRNILLVEAFSTLVASFFGGVVQSTPYIGHPAYKAMGGRAGYALFTGVFIGVGAALGLIPFIVSAMPQAAVMPILIFIGLEIVGQAHHATPRRHSAAVILAFIPSIAELVRINLSKFGVFPDKLAAGEALDSYMATMALGRGFILTGMLWGAAAAWLIDRRFKAAALILFILAAFSLFGVIHSVSMDGGLYWPLAIKSTMHFHIAAGYAMLGAMCLFAGTGAKKSEFKEE